MDEPPKPQKPLFIYFLVYQLVFHPDAAKPTPLLLYIYPGLADKDRAICSQLPDFFFPDYAAFPKKALGPDEKSHFFTLSAASSKQYGFVARDMSSKSHKGCPTAFCIFTDYPYQGLFEHVLAVLMKSFRTRDMAFMDELSLYLRSQKVPDPGDSVSFPLKLMTDVPPATREIEPFSIFNSDSMEKLLISLDSFELATVYLSLLLERRIIFVSSRISFLGDCVHAACSLLWPMTWQHVYIPILPPNKLDFVCAPMPFVVGILASDLEAVLSMPMDEVMFVYLDTPACVTGKATAFFSLPPNLFYSLVATFQEIRNVTVEALEAGKKPEMTVLKNGIISFISRLLKPVPEFIDGGKFSTDKFIASTNPDLKDFIKELTDSQLFNRYKNQFVGPTIAEPFVQEFVHMLPSFEPQEINYSTPEFSIRTGVLLKQVSKNGGGHSWAPHFVQMNHTCILLKPRAESEPITFIPFYDILSIDDYPDPKYSCFALRTNAGVCIIGSDDSSQQDVLSQWKLLIEYCTKHSNSTAPIILPAPRKKKNFLKKVVGRGVTRRSGSVPNIVTPSLKKKDVKPEKPVKESTTPPSPSILSIRTKERKSSVSAFSLSLKPKKNEDKNSSVESSESPSRRTVDLNPLMNDHTPMAGEASQPESPHTPEEDSSSSMDLHSLPATLALPPIPNHPSPMEPYRHQLTLPPNSGPAPNPPRHHKTITPQTPPRLPPSLPRTPTQSSLGTLPDTPPCLPTAHNISM